MKIMNDSLVVKSMLLKYGHDENSNVSEQEFTKNDQNFYKNDYKI